MTDNVMEEGEIIDEKEEGEIDPNDTLTPKKSSKKKFLHIELSEENKVSGE